MDATAVVSEQANQGKVLGVIIPPPDIRAIVDKTALFVSRNGKSFEQKIMNSAEGKTPKFNFMRHYDPYHAYYEFKIREFEEISSKPVEESKTASGQSEQVQSPQIIETNDIMVPLPTAHPTSKSSITSMKASYVNPIARITFSLDTTGADSLELNRPYPFEFISGSYHGGISAMDIDVIKLTAQYTAVNGRDFLAGLAQKEQRNPQFDFLKPTHLLFSYFTSLVDSYSKILNPSMDTIQRIHCHSRSRSNTKDVGSTALDTAVRRWGWVKKETERKQKDELAADAERIAFQSIDWFDFSVVETIDFPYDELFDQMSIGVGVGVTSTSGVQGNSSATATTMPAANTAQVDIKWARKPIAPPLEPISFKPSLQQQSISDSVDEDMDVDMDMDDRDDDESEIRVVSNADYVPRMASAAAVTSLEMIDPVSGKAVPAEQMEEHMRVQLLDPKWRVEQKRFLDKQKDTGFAAGVSIADSLKLFAKKRGDIFGAGDEGDQLIDDSEVESQAINTVQWDGARKSVAATLQMHNDIVSRLPISQPTYGQFYSSQIGPSTTGAPANIIATPAPPSNLPPPPSFIGMVPPPPPMMLNPAPVHMSLPIPPIMVQTAPHIPPSIPISMATGMPSFQPSSYFSTAPPSQPSYGNAPYFESVPKSDSGQVPADDFAARYPNPINISIAIPTETDASSIGERVLISIEVTATIREVKELIALKLGGAWTASKQQLKSLSTGVFLKDAMTLAALNIGDNSSLELSARSRGGGKR